MIVVNSYNERKFTLMQFKNVTIEQVNEFSKGTLMEHLEIEVVEIGDSFLRARMPVDKRTVQPMGLLHGGASVTLIESLGSIGSSLLVDMEKEYPVGLEVNANHVGSATSGFVEGKAELLHLGRKTHVWKVDVKMAETNKLICTGRLTIMVVKRK